MGRNITLDPQELKHIELIDLYPYVTWHKNSQYFDLQAGREHYRLLAWLSLQLQKHEVVYDIGTYLGFSALALSYNRTCKVKTYDLVSCIPKNQISPEYRSNIEFHIENILETKDFLTILDAPIIVLDTNHDGVFEKKFYNALYENEYRGLLVCDDIHLNPQMEEFWNSILLDKIDVTSVGHWSGTGIVMFDKTYFSFNLA
jgi:hypothetical protein